MILDNMSYDINNPKFENKKEVNEIINQKVNVRMIGEVVMRLSFWEQWLLNEKSTWLLGKQLRSISTKVEDVKNDSMRIL